MLSADEIVEILGLDALDKKRLTVVPLPDKDALRRRGATSIDLRLGRWFRSFKQTRTNFVSLVGPGSGEKETSEASRTRQHFVPFGKSYVLHPGRFVLGATLEWLSLPAGISGYITGISSLGRHGLVIETAAGVHPIFSGCLTLELANVGEVPLEIFPGMPICQIFLHRTKEASSIDYGKFSGKRKPTLTTPMADDIFHKIKDI